MGNCNVQSECQVRWKSMILYRWWLDNEIVTTGSQTSFEPIEGLGL